MGIGIYSLSGSYTGQIRDYGYPYNAVCDGNGHIFAVNWNSSSIGEYTTSGAIINESLITGLQSPWGIALDGQGDLFVASYGNYGNGFIGEYTTSGAVINASLISGLSGPYGIALDGAGDIFVANNGNGTIGEYTTSGEVVNASLISGLSGPFGIAIIPEPTPMALAMLASLLFWSIAKRSKSKIVHG